MGFKRTKEDFTCEHCAHLVHGTGYTNHCPKCLWSKHVDIDPGDRAHSCGGLMAPVGLEGTTDKYRIRHRCIKCGHIAHVYISTEDDPEALLDLVRKSVS